MSAYDVNDCYVALELSQRTWLIGYLLPGSEKVKTISVAGGDSEALINTLSTIRSMVGSRSSEGRSVEQVRVCFEAVYDGCMRRPRPIDFPVSITG